MATNNWKDTAELIGIAAIVASLIFVGLQMRQTQVIAQATLYQMRSDSAQVLNTALLFPDQLQTAIIKQGTDLTALERQALVSLSSLWLGHFENSHHLYQLELLPEEQWESDKAQMIRTFSSQDFLRTHWGNTKSTYRKSFAREVDNLLGSAREDQ